MSRQQATEKDLACIDIVIAEANAAIDAGKAGVGAMLTWRGDVLAVCHNTYAETHDITAHGEMTVLRKLAEKLDAMSVEEKQDLCMYVTLEPCLMCMAAMSYAGIPRVVYAALSEDANIEQALLEGETARTINDGLVRGPIELVPGVRREQGIRLLERMHMRSGEPDSGVGHTG
ncbi:nucleoside deaminase [Gloeobacter kilaueensis]|uniref:tRNA-specific adenosine deaminase n=1 Tax=Gloeobacter kilaueensis (strain ATCC BAA-2537 / CCAP 1431/1 / ULC 316 / JS1) TaxID=1183438 RepID=U5QFE6_GLOK1|nr:nucleoside deaminase [Gloeobacter kilaueensis]AGY57666.1 tRNA-specific adenosine deaminase [Gloeobacter kilaueensis JS1]